MGTSVGALSRQLHTAPLPVPHVPVEPALKLAEGVLVAEYQSLP